MKLILIALGFLTRIPIPKNILQDEAALSRSILFFPIVGCLLGVILTAVNKLAGLFFPDSITTLILIIASILLTGGFHMDGFADTVDGFSAKTDDKNKVLAIMRDSRIGAMAAIGLIILVLFKYEALKNIPEASRAAALILMCTLSRYSQVVSAYFSRYAGQGEGLGRIFVGKVRRADFYLAGAFSFLISFVLGLGTGLLVFAAVFLTTIGFVRYSARRIGGMTGDTIGFVNEITEVMVLLAIYAGRRISW